MRAILKPHGLSSGRNGRFPRPRLRCAKLRIEQDPALRPGNRRLGEDYLVTRDVVGLAGLLEHAADANEQPRGEGGVGGHSTIPQVEGSQSPIKL